MHRSGTSLFSRITNLLGASLPQRLVGALPGNETGHWEPERLVEINEEMLSEMGSQWDDWRLFDPTNIRLDHYRDLLKQAILEEYGGAELFVIKDPRICRFAWLYEEVLSELGVATVYVLSHRNPLSVIASLAARDKLGAPFARLLWLRHVLDAEAQSRGKARIFSGYEDLLADWRGVTGAIAQTMGRDWPHHPDEAAGAIEKYMARDRQHHSYTLDDLRQDAAAGRAVVETYEALLSLTNGDRAQQAEAKLDALKAELDRASTPSVDATFAELHTRQVREISHHKYLNWRAEDAETRADHSREKSLGLEAIVAELTSGLSAAQADAAKAAKQSEALQVELSRTAASLATTRREARVQPRRSIRGLRRSVEGALVDGRLLGRVGGGTRGTEGALVRKARRLGDLRDLPEESVRSVLAAFDSGFYLARNADVADSNVDPFEHYLTVGWKEGRDPSPEFSTNYYLRNSADVVTAGANPFVHWVLHGAHEKRPGLPFQRRLARRNGLPKVAAIVLKDDDAVLLGRRLDSILSQRYPNLEVIVLGDYGTNECRGVVDWYLNAHPTKIRATFDETPSEDPISQWRKGIAETDAELIWVSESGDVCEPSLLEKLVPHFEDRSVNVAFGRIQFADRDGALQEGAEQRREYAEAGIWASPVVRPAGAWFRRALGVDNIILSAGGCIWRRQDLAEDTWLKAARFPALWDWFLYLNVAGGGQIAYEPDAISYFRRRENVAMRESSRKEHRRLMMALSEFWGATSQTIVKFWQSAQWRAVNHSSSGSDDDPDNHFNISSLRAYKRDRPHILVAFAGSRPDPDELSPIALANEFRLQGHVVSLLAPDTNEIHPDLLKQAAAGIPVYDAAWVAEYGADTFLADAGVSVILSHSTELDRFFLEKGLLQTRIPYIVSLHGPYVTKASLDHIVAGVTRFVYEAEQDLAAFKSTPEAAAKFIKFSDTTPLERRPETQANHCSGWCNIRNVAESYLALFERLWTIGSSPGPGADAGGSEFLWRRQSLRVP